MMEFVLDVELGVDLVYERETLNLRQTVCAILRSVPRRSRVSLLLLLHPLRVDEVLLVLPPLPPVRPPARPRHAVVRPRALAVVILRLDARPLDALAHLHKRKLRVAIFKIQIQKRFGETLDSNTPNPKP